MNMQIDETFTDTAGFMTLDVCKTFSMQIAANISKDIACASPG